MTQLLEAYVPFSISNASLVLFLTQFYFQKSFIFYFSLKTDFKERFQKKKKNINVNICAQLYTQVIHL